MSGVASNGVQWRTLHAWSQPQCEALGAYWGERLRQFVAQWCPEGPTDTDIDVMTLSPALCHEAREPLGLYAAQESTPHAWLWAHPAAGAGIAPRVMSIALFGRQVGAAPEASIGVACDALSALVQSLGFDRYEAGNGLPPPSLHAPWAGALGLTFSIDSTQWAVALSAPAVQRLVERSGIAASTPVASTSAARGTVTLREAVGNARVTLQVKFESTSLTLGALADLREGDIVTLSHDLSTPLRIETSTGEPVCVGHLGRRDDRFAIEFMGGNEPSNPQEPR